MRPLHVTRLLAALAAGSVCVCTAQTQTAPPPSGGKNTAGSKPLQGKPDKPKQPNIFIIGDVTLNYQAGLEIAGTGDITVHGPGASVETTNKKRDTQMVILADVIKAPKKPKGHETAQFDDNVHYTVHQKIKAGERIIEGTADHAYYMAFNKTLRLMGHVNATLTDPSRFDAPATVRAARLIVSDSGSYQIDGDAGTNDLNFTPHYAPAKPNAENAAPFRIGTAHIYGFTKGVMEVEKSARFDGPQVTIETANAQEKTQNTLKAPHVMAQLQENNQRLEAEGGVQFDTHRADVQGNIQVIAGTADSAVFVEAVRETDKATKKTKTITPAQLDVNGSINATLTNPVSLREPASLAADHLTAHLGDEPRYVITGAPAHTRFTLAPRVASSQTKADDSPAPSGNAGAPDTTPAHKAIPGVRPPDTVEIKNVIVPNPAASVNANPPAGADAASKTTVPAAAALDADDPDDPKSNPPASGGSGKSAPPFIIGDLSATAFQNAVYVPDKSLLIEGPKVRFTSSDAKTKNYAEMLTPHLEADFVVNSVTVAPNKTRKVTTLTEMRAINGVTYKFQKPLPSGNTETLTGTGRATAFTNSAKAQIVKVEGVSIAELTNPDKFSQPVHVGGDGDIDRISYDFLSRDFHFNTPAKGTKIDIHPRMNADTKPAANSKTKKPAVKKNH